MAQWDPGSWMWEQAFDLMLEADRLRRRFFLLGRPRASLPSWEPPVDIFETGEEIRIVVALPGVAPERVSVALTGAVLVISGERVWPIQSGRAVVHRLEIPHGRFETSLELPAGRFEVDQREIVNGCLILSLKKL